MDSFAIIKIFILSTLAFILAFLLTPVLTHFLYKYRLGKGIRDVAVAPVFAALHQKKAGTPTMGGILIWVTALILILFFFYLSLFTGGNISRLNFLTRSETLLPLGALIASAIVGLFDDLIDIWRVGKDGGGLRMRHRFFIYTIIAAVGAWWFYFKLEWTVLHVPFYGNFDIGAWYIPIFIFIIIAAAHAVNITDGLDGLAGGTLLTAFSAYGAIAFAQGKFDLAALCGVIAGALLAFLWFNINPARFFMGDTGAMALGMTLGILAFLTDTVFILPIIGLVLYVEGLSAVVQILSKKLRHGKKIFLSAPIHHHFEAKGWPEPRITMRFWIISAVSAMTGLFVFLVSR